MSRSNPDDYAKNPATKFFDWAGDEGKLVYYDRDLKENVEVDLPFSFLILDEVMTVGGGVDNDDGFVGYWSNAIRPRNAKKEMLTVRSSHNGKTRVEMTGLWADIKGTLPGAKYIKGLYIGYFADGELSIGYLKVRGAAGKEFMEFQKEHRDMYAGAFSITDKVKRKKGSNTYFGPVFSFNENVKEETNEAALALDRDILQPYLREYFNKPDEVEYTGEAKAAHAGSAFNTEQDAQRPIETEEVDDFDPPF